MFACLAFVAFALAAVLFFAPILWARRDEFRHPRHHDHLIPPTPASYRSRR